MIPVIVVLLITGCVLILASFIFKDAFSGQKDRTAWTEDEIERLVERRFSEVKYRLDDEAERSADQIKDQTERELEKLSNEKIMAVNEYSDQVMDQINKNHNEVMFLYSMLNDKQKELDHAVERLNRFKRQAENEEKLARHADSRPAAEDAAAAAVPEKERHPQEKEEKQETAGNRQAEKIQKLSPGTGQKEKYSNKQKIFQMYEEGMSITQIARKLHLGVGEVRLVLELSGGRKEES